MITQNKTPHPSLSLFDNYESYQVYIAPLLIHLGGQYLCITRIYLHYTDRKCSLFSIITSIYTATSDNIVCNRYKCAIYKYVL